MKFNFKRIASVLTGVVMLSSTIALAAATANQFPEPFVKSGSADVAVVYGSNVKVAQTDIDSALNIARKLNNYVVTASVTPAAGGSVTSGSGDNVTIEKSSDKLNLRDSLSSVWGTSLTKSELPTMLGEGKFYNKQNTEYKYTQKFDLGDNLNFTHFSSSSYDNRKPTLGFQLNANTHVANYTLSFSPSPESTNAADLTDFEGKSITLLGKSYYILDFKNSTAKITLLDTANTVNLNDGETKTVTVGSKTYTISINFISTDELVLKVNNELTDKLSATGTTYGNTYKLSDGTYIGIKTINSQNYAGGTKNAEFSLGTGKLEITSGGGNVKINDKTITDLYGYITLVATSSKMTWQKLVLEWKIESEAFLTPGKELVMPGFEAIKFMMSDTVIPAKENTRLEYSSSDVVELKTAIKSGNVTIPLLYMGTANNITGIGKSATLKLATTNETTLVYNATLGSTSQYDGFIVSWNNSRDSESYYLKPTVTRNLETGANYTTFTNQVTKEEYCPGLDYTISTTCNIGGSNVVLTVTPVLAWATGEKTITMAVNSGGSFNRLYTAEGLTVYLPYLAIDADANSTAKGAVNFVFGKAEGHNSTSVYMFFKEEDKDGTLGAGNGFNATIGSSGTGTSSKITVSAVDTVSTGYETETSSKIWEYYVKSDLASRVRWDKTASEQYSAAVEYHGGQLQGKVLVASPALTSSSTNASTVNVTNVGIPYLTDAQVATQAPNKNLIVVGGSCINTVAATLLGSATPLCGEDFSKATQTKVGRAVGTGNYLVAAFDSPYNANKTAMLVAGWEAGDTVSAATYLTTQAENVSTKKGDVVVNGVKVTVSG